MFVRLLCAALLLSVSSVSRCAPVPEVWMSHHHAEDLVKPHARWDAVKQGMGTLEIPINIIAFRIRTDDLKQLVRVLRQNNIKTAIECGYFDSCNESTDYSAPNPKGITDRVREVLTDSVGEETARNEISKVKLLADCGGTVDYINMDGPVRRMLYPAIDLGRYDTKGFKTIDKCVDEMIDYMRIWRQSFPNVQFFALTNFPNWGWKGEPAYWGTGKKGMFWGDYYTVLKVIAGRTRKAGMPVLGVTTDNPYEYYLGTHPLPPGSVDIRSRVNWRARLLDLEKEVESRGLEFNLIVNSQVGGVTSDEAFARGSLAFLHDYTQMGGLPKRVIMQSWYKYPVAVVSETEPWTMTWLVKQAIVRTRR